jgi:hypothetical protein
MPNSKSSRLTRAKNPMPVFVRNALNERGLMAAYNERPPYQRNDYLGWIARAKLEATKLKRLNTMLDELQSRRRYMNMVWKPHVERANNSLQSKNP